MYGDSQETFITIIIIILLLPIILFPTFPEVLRIEDTREVLDFFWEYRSKWRLIGIQLGIKMSTLDAIDTNKRSVVEECLPEMISKWLHGSNPKSTRTSMNAALRAKCLAGEDTSHEKNQSRPHYNSHTA